MDIEDQKAIIRAAKRGELKIIQSLVRKEPGLLSARDKDGSTPVHCAAWKDHPEVLKWLLDQGADINAQNENDHWGTTPLHAAAHGNQKQVAILLLERSK